MSTDDSASIESELTELGLSEDLIGKIMELEPEVRAERLEVARTWALPAKQLRSMVDALDTDQVASYHVRSAEGIATYQGMFDAASDLTPEEEALLTEAVLSVARGDHQDADGEALH